MNERRSGLLVVLEAVPIGRAGFKNAALTQRPESSSRNPLRAALRLPTGSSSFARRCELAVRISTSPCSRAATVRTLRPMARRGILRSVADIIPRRNGGRLLLTADARQRGTMRKALCDIARDIAAEWQTRTSR